MVYGKIGEWDIVGIVVAEMQNIVIREYSFKKT